MVSREGLSAWRLRWQPHETRLGSSAQEWTVGARVHGRHLRLGAIPGLFASFGKPAPVSASVSRAPTYSQQAVLGSE